MSGLASMFGGGGGYKAPDIKPTQIAAQKVEPDAASNAIFERQKRAAVYGKQQTMLTGGNMAAPIIQRKTLLGAL